MKPIDYDLLIYESCLVEREGADLTDYKVRNNSVLFLPRCVTSMVYYGLSFNSGNLAGDFYLNFAASGLVEIPAYLLATYLVER